MSPLHVDRIPGELKSVSQWVLWSTEDRNGRPTKVPYSASTLGRAACDCPNTWTSFDAAFTRFQNGGYDGVGFVFTRDDQYVGVDLDKCMDRQTGEIHPAASAIVTQLQSYTERSPSGTGLHVIVRGVVPPGGNRKGMFEVYDHGRYFTMTGDHLPGTPKTIEDRADHLKLLHEIIFGVRQSSKPQQITPAPGLDDGVVIQRASQAKNGHKFARLWDGDVSAHGSHSEADLALCHYLAFWTGRNVGQMDRLFRQSGLYRNKWDERHGEGTYGNRTIAKACAQCREVYSPSVQHPFVEPPATRPFPVESLPHPIRVFCEEAARALPASIELIAVPALVTLGSAIGSARVIELKAGWQESAALYAAIVHPPGTLKSPALVNGTGPVKQRQRAYTQAYKSDLLTYELAQARYTRELEAYRKRNVEDPPAKPTKPVLRRTWTADCTTERLAGMLGENPHGVLIIRDELSAWAKSLNQYKNGKGSDRQFFLSAWSGADVAVDRQGRDSLVVDRPFLSIVGCVPPDILSELDASGGKEDGFIHRVLFAYPKPVPVQWNNDTVSGAAKQAYETVIESLFALAEESSIPRVLLLTEEARALFIAWHNEHCLEMESGRLASGLRGFYAKLKGYCARLALIHQLAVNPQSTQVGVLSIAAACDLTDYFKEQAAIIAPLLIPQKRTPHDQCEQTIRRLLENDRVLTKREIQRSCKFHAVIFNQVFEALVQADQLVPVMKPGGKGEREAFRLAKQDEDPLEA